MKEQATNKLCITFPGMGYHADKPLLYFGKKLMASAGYKVIDLKYPTELPFEDPIECFRRSEATVLPVLDAVPWQDYSQIAFISKSIGTIIAARYSQKLEANGLAASDKSLATEDSIPYLRNCYCTPIPETIPFMQHNGIAFHGKADPRMNTEELIQGCKEHGIPLYCYEDANHSIETGDVFRNLEYLQDIVKKYKEYLLSS